MSQDRRYSIALGALGVLAVLALMYASMNRRLALAQICPTGLVPSSHACCPPGQRWAGGGCVGQPTSCPVPLQLVSKPVPACVLSNRPVSISGGSLELSSQDWDGQQVLPRKLQLKDFRIDSAEVTSLRWGRCVTDGQCQPLTAPALGHVPPGQSVRGVSPEAAAQFCRFAGGRLPSDDEWIFAAAGSEGRKFPWGPSGLVCRRSAFGLEQGPCRHPQAAPDLAGTHASGNTPEGVFDLSGNVAEWTTRAEGGYSARGGSFRSRVASQLKSWSGHSAREKADDIGFRCVY